MLHHTFSFEADSSSRNDLGIVSKISIRKQCHFHRSTAVKHLHKRSGFMKNSLPKKHQYTTITFNENSDLIDLITFNTSLKNRLTEFAEKYPEECRITDRDDNGSISCEIRKGRMSFKLSAPYSEDRRKKASDLAKQNANRLRNQKS